MADRYSRLFVGNLQLMIVELGQFMSPTRLVLQFHVTTRLVGQFQSGHVIKLRLLEATNH